MFGPVFFPLLLWTIHSCLLLCFYYETNSLPILAEPLPGECETEQKPFYYGFWKREGGLLKHINPWWELSAVCIVMLLLDHNSLIIVSCKNKSVLGGKIFFRLSGRRGQISAFYISVYGVCVFVIYSLVYIIITEGLSKGKFIS